MSISLSSGCLCLNDVSFEIPPLNVEHPPDYVSNITFPLSASAEFSLETEIDIPTFCKLCGVDSSPLAGAESFSVQWSAPYQEQIRRHRKKRINKKWAKRYGYRTAMRKCQMDNVTFVRPYSNEIEIYGDNLRIAKGV